MKKFFIICLMFAPLISLSVDLIADLTEKEISDTVEALKDAAVGIGDVGFSTWVKANWWLFILALVGLGRLIVYITPSKEDDKWYEKWVLKPVRYIGQFISFGVGKDRDPVKK